MDKEMNVELKNDTRTVASAANMVHVSLLTAAVCGHRSNVGLSIARRCQIIP